MPARAVLTRDGSGLGDASVKAKLENMDLIQSPSQFIVRGSLARFGRGDNVGDFTLSMVRDALDRLECELQYPIRKGQVWELEVARTLIMRFPPSQYLTLWGDVPRFCKTTFPNGLTVLYHNGRRSFQGYDKSAQVGLAGLPERYRGRNLLRLEYKFKKELTEVLGSKLTVAGLTDPDQYIHFLREFKRFALSIPQDRNPRPVWVGGMKNMKDSLAAIAISSMGGPHALLADLAGQLGIMPSQRSKMKAELLALTQESAWNNPNELSQELHQKVRMAVSHFR